MKTVLIISPHFPPISAADMHRVRQSIPYFKDFGWEPIVLSVEPQYVERQQDELLLETIPPDTEVHHVKAFSTTWTRKAGLGSLGLRSLWFYLRAGNRLLSNRKIDLVYFSTTMFPVLVLGRYWKWKYGIPYVIDMQDPWYSKHFLKRPRNERPPKYWVAHQLNRFLEPIAMKKVSGIIAVAKGYCQTLQEKYNNIKPEFCTVIPFGAYEKDMEVLEKRVVINRFFKTNKNIVNIVYVGRGGYDMDTACRLLFSAFKMGLQRDPKLFQVVKFYFIGTDYAPADRGRQTIFPIAEKLGVAQYVKEYPGRVPYFEALELLREADMLVIPGSTEANYTASKLYPYILVRKPMLTIFHEDSSVVDIVRATNAGELVTFGDQLPVAGEGIDKLIREVYEKWKHLLSRLPFTPDTDWAAFEPYTAREMTKKQVAFFESMLNK